jgi:hypothetical protein
LLSREFKEALRKLGIPGTAKPLTDFHKDAHLLLRLGSVGVGLLPKLVCIRGGDAQKQRADERKSWNPMDHLGRYFRYAVEGFFAKTTAL